MTGEGGCDVIDDKGDEIDNLGRVQFLFGLGVNPYFIPSNQRASCQSFSLSLIGLATMTNLPKLPPIFDCQLGYATHNHL